MGDQVVTAALNMDAPAIHQNPSVQEILMVPFPSFVLIVTWNALDPGVIAAQSMGAPVIQQNLCAPNILTLSFPSFVPIATWFLIVPFPSFVPIVTWNALDQVAIAARSTGAPATPQNLH